MCAASSPTFINLRHPLVEDHHGFGHRRLQTDLRLLLLDPEIL